MKKYTLLFLMMMFAGINLYGQPLSASTDTLFQQSKKGRYLRTHKTLKTVGWVSLGTGLPMIALGFVYGIAGIESADPKSAERTGNLLAASGAALTVASIPCFIISHHYKKKAATLALANQQVFVPAQNGFVLRAQPALCLRIPF